MKPIRDIPSETLRDVAWVGFDVDDTVTDHGRLAARSLDAMDRLARAGVKLAAVTGRPLGWAQAFIAQWPIDLAIGENGAGWFARHGRRVDSGLYVDDASRIASERARAIAIGSRVSPSIPIPPDGITRQVDVAFDIAETRVADATEVDRLDDALREAGFHTVRSSIHLHAAFEDWNKARGLARALDRAFGESLDALGERFLFVGDSANDVPVFESLRLTIGVANVRRHALPTYPTYVADDEGSLGFAAIADAILATKGVR